MNEQEIIHILKKQRVDHARPWEAISTEYLTAREFFSLVGIEGRGRDYRQALIYLEIASKRDNSGNVMPDYLKKCFRNGVVRVHVFRSRNERLVGVEYRIPVESLDESYGERVKELVSSRNSRVSDPISRGTLRKLKRISEITHRSVEEILNGWVNREMDDVLGRSGRSSPFGE
ncbi:MAG: hypothetical protein A4E61_01154 [Syntrophorhabdus sp. PtaB.Bin184]|nr:MAG: hypothetical protein A4E61_01154 [Syntrophorhabdus sp. PtaB.Bin184]